MEPGSYKTIAIRESIHGSLADQNLPPFSSEREGTNREDCFLAPFRGFKCFLVNPESEPYAQ